jgi:hypothetical protein
MYAKEYNREGGARPYKSPNIVPIRPIKVRSNYESFV